MVGAVALGCKDKSRLRSTGVVLCVWCSVYLERRTHANGDVSRVRVGSM